MNYGDEVASMVTMMMNAVAEKHIGHSTKTDKNNSGRVSFKITVLFGFAYFLDRLPYRFHFILVILSYDTMESHGIVCEVG